MINQDTLTNLVKGKLNVTWSDAGTDARLEAILFDAVPSVCNMVGLRYYDGEAIDENSEIFDFSVPSMERNLLLNYIAYEWNHKADLFRETYWSEIAACRQHHVLVASEVDSDDGE